eukprot:TRINITY_DN45753_c0_g1_i3.p1 TRINITY_DN45753_c0_g1~~TRINITY_DN45753_c0_g1_i3.p1  ORF type:complete len:223 (-),score=30.35 TRINITY_DN45753_c0_g1_i3:149-817(-)
MFSSIGWTAQRITGVDGADPIAFAQRVCLPEFSYTLSRSELACTASHVAAIEQAWEDGHEMALIMEDDMDATPCAQLLPELEAVLRALPGDWEILQLHTSSVQALQYVINSPPNRMVRWNPIVYSTGAYLVNRQGMGRLRKLFPHTKSGQMCFPECPNLQADSVIYSSCSTFVTRPLFVHGNGESTIHDQRHVEMCHDRSRALLLQYFRDKGISTRDSDNVA